MKFKQLREPSTWASFAVLLTAFGLNIENEVLQPAIQGLTGLFGVLGIMLTEKSDER